MFKDHALQNSPYLTALLKKYEQHPLILEYAADDENKTQVLNTIIEELNNYDPQLLSNTQQIMEYVRQQKNIFSLLWSIFYLDNDLSQQQAGKLQSEFAAATIELAFKAACSISEFEKFKDPEKHIIPGIFILGLGKLGGYDLNFSSDVDLVAFYDGDIISIGERLGRTHLVSKLLMKMTYILSHTINNEFVWRVDWRLRPNASVKYLSMPVNQAINFYFFQSMPWHRLAMIKARIVGGDFAAGQSFLEDINSYLWKRNLDFRTIDEIASLKQRINSEHPRLQKQREFQKDDSLSTLEGFNFKLGHGGIREIEFLVNAMQLIWGGKKENLRQLSTLDNLQELINEELIEKDLGLKLAEAYQFLRRSEDALQMLMNQQTHTTPNNLMDLENWLKLLGVNKDEFSKKLKSYRVTAFDEFTNLFNDGEKEAEVELDWAKFKKPLSERSKSIIDDWQQGFLIYGSLPSQASQLVPLAKQLAKIIKDSGLEYDHCIIKVDTYLRQLPGGGQYLSLLHKHPQLLDKLISPLLLSSGMAILLEQSPHIIDCFLESPNQGYEPDIDRDYILNEKDHEQALEKLRRLTNEELYRQYLFYLENKITSEQLEKNLTQQAQEILQLALDLTYNYLKIDNSCLSIIGLGKLGMKTLMPLSDIDLMYLFDDNISIQQANKIASHLNTVLHTRMREGRVYEIDTRLRPSGRSGSPTISLASFEKYHQTQVFNWEHLALFPARFICGQASTGERFAEIKNTSLTRQRDQQQWRTDALKMFERIRSQRIQEDSGFSFSSKLRDGGLMQAEYLLACHGVEVAQQNPEILNVDYLDTIKHIDVLERADFLESLNFWRKLQIAIRIFGHEDTDIEQLPVYIQSNVLNHLNAENLSDLNEKINFHAKKVQNLAAEYFSSVDPAVLDNWKESPIIWTL